MNRPTRTILEETDAAGALRQTATSHIGFRVPDVAATADFYGRVLGLPGVGVNLDLTYR